MRFAQPLFLIFICGGLVIGAYFHLDRARDNARRSSCQYNLKQTGLGFAQYMQDYDNRLPLVAVTPQRIVESARDAKGRLLPNAPVFGWLDAIQPYIKNSGVGYCASEITSGNLSDYTKPLMTDFWMNAQVSGARLKSIVNPSRVFLHGDGDGRDADSTARYSKSGPPTKTYDDRQPIWTERHLGGANYSFVDGHVKWLRPNEISAAPGAPFTFSPK